MGEEEDVSFARDGSIIVQRLGSRAFGEAPRAGATIRLLVNSVSDGPNVLQGALIPQVIEGVLGDGDVCDALEAATFALRCNERASVRCTRPDWCVDKRLGLQRVIAKEVTFDVKLIGMTQAPDCLTLPPIQRLEFAEARFMAAQALQDRRRWAAACQGYRCVREVLLLDAATSFGAEDALRIEDLAATSRLNWQVCLVFYYREAGELRLRRQQQLDGKRRILVCQGATCCNGGAKAVKTEIEELVSATGAGAERCSVETAPCLSMCGRGPNAVVLQVDSNGQEAETPFTGLDSIQKSAVVVEYATELRAPLDDTDQLQRMARRRAFSAAQSACSGPKWNRALKLLKLAEAEAEGALQDEMHRELLYRQAVVLEAVGAYQQAIQHVDRLTALSPETAVELTESRSQLLNKLVKDDPLVVLSQGRFAERDVMDEAAAANGGSTQPPRNIKWYARWKLKGVEPVSRWTAFFRFSCSAPDRGDSGGRWQLWHRTLLAEVGPNTEGPMPWVEREYTPIKEETIDGTTTLTLLVKIQPLGLASNWLRRLEIGADVYISKPMASLLLPSMVPPDRVREAFEVRSLLFIVGGSGLAPVLQVLDKLHGVERLALHYCCCVDDMLSLNRLQGFMVASKRRMPLLNRLAVWSTLQQENVKMVVYVSHPRKGMAFPFPQFEESPEIKALAATYPELEFRQGRLSSDAVATSISALSMGSLRAVVCGPPSLNDAANKMLQTAGLPKRQVTIMKATA